MTPEERAERIADYTDQSPSLTEELRAEAVRQIREAVAAERERIARLAESVEAIYETSVPNPDGPGEMVHYHNFAALIRKGV